VPIYPALGSVLTIGYELLTKPYIHTTFVTLLVRLYPLGLEVMNPLWKDTEYEPIVLLEVVLVELGTI